MLNFHLINQFVILINSAKNWQKGNNVIDTSLEFSTAIIEGFLFDTEIDCTHTKQARLKASWLETPIGSMLAIADDEALHFLDFYERRSLKREIKRFKNTATITPGRTSPIDSIEKELQAYFAGSLQSFKTPLTLCGSPFQKRVWNGLLKISYGETSSYAQQAIALDKPTAYRAVANANGANKFAILIPCHRIINKNGQLGGYGSGLERKKWLLKHETTYGKTSNAQNGDKY